MESELPFRQVAQDLPTPCWISDSEGSIIWVNTAWLAYTGMDVDAIQKLGLEQLHDPAVYPKVRERWDALKALGQSAEMVFPLKGRDGKLRPFLTRVVPLRDPSGAVSRWFGTNADVSEQSRVEEDLRESERRLELATEAAELGIWDWNLNDNTFVYSPRARAICGFPSDLAVTLEDVVRVTHPEDYPRTSAIAQRALDPTIKSNERYRYRVVRPDGAVRIVEAQGRALFEQTSEGVERATRYVGTLLDVTEITELAEASKETAAVLGSLFEASELYIAVVEVTEDSFRYILVNQATSAFYGQPHSSSGFDAHDIGIPAKELAQWRATFLDIWQSGKPRTMEYAFDGGRGVAWYLGTYTPLPAGPEGRPRISFVVIDVSERKQAEERQALLMREVDHRAKNALAVAQAIVRLTRAENVEAFRRAVQGRVAALARVHTLLADERWAGADLARLVREELEPYVSDAPSRAIVNGPAYSLSPAVAQTIGLVFHELATNAAKYGAFSQPDGAVMVTWNSEANGDLTIAWRETLGSPLSDFNRRGFGFTLMEQSIEKQLGGRWRIERLDDGLVYTIFVPQAVASQEQIVPGTPVDGALFALVVEDEPLIALALEEELSGLAVTVGATAARLSDAETFRSAQHFDLALVDLNLAGESTIGLARSLREAGTAVIFCTGYQNANLPPDLAAAPVLIKPIQAGDLKRALEISLATLRKGAAR
jgi:PAS domain S-box-containing protein